QEVVKQDAAGPDNPPKKVLPPTLALTLLDEDGAPIVGVDVSAMEGNVSGKESDSARTDQNGKAVFKHLKSGTYYFFANLKAVRSHRGYDFPLIVKEIKSIRSYYISETRKFDLSENAECTYTIKRSAYISFETFLNVFKSDKIVVVNKKLGIGQNIPVEADFIKIYMPMRSQYQIITVKDGDFDSWIIDFYAHEGLRVELL
ncbi:MAG: carboxypeptidase-like regulatory domain-containing protein, partial [Negativicutes bacterium]|nr:carboxypeptidase-like regulatory domain-containing protein [Negativicutes bacterium]